jgi:hypothetical protein
VGTRLPDVGEIIRARDYEAGQVIEALAMVARCAGNSSEASRRIGIPKETLGTTPRIFACARSCSFCASWRIATASRSVFR